MGNTRFNLKEIRISYIFNIANPISDIKELEQMLIDKKYKINNERLITRPPFQLVILNFARKGDINVMYEKEKIPSFIGVTGSNLQRAVSEFEQLTDGLNSIDSMIVEQKHYIEAVLTYEVLIKSITPYNNLSNFASQEINRLTKNSHLENITITTKNNNDTTRLHIAPLYKDPKFFYIQSVMTSDNIENTISFVENQETVINNTLMKLGDG